MSHEEARVSALAGWSAEATEQGRQWVQVWREAGPRLEEIRRRELREMDPYDAIAKLCGPGDYRVAPRAPRPTSGLVDQQRVFARGRTR
jgi:hypothetical protein